MGDDYDRIKSGLARFIMRVTGRLDYLALYPCKVVAQNGQRLDLAPDNTNVPQMTGVPIRLGVPGLAVKVSNGARVLLGFENGDPKKPVATLWEVPNLDQLYLGTSLDGGDTTEAAVRGTTWRMKEQALHQKLLTDLSSASVALLTAGPAIAAAGASLTVAGATVLLPPSIPGFLAAGASLTAAGPAIITAGTQLANASVAIGTYESEAAAAQNHLSTIVKVR